MALGSLGLPPSTNNKLAHARLVATAQRLNLHLASRPRATTQAGVGRLHSEQQRCGVRPSGRTQALQLVTGQSGYDGTEPGGDPADEVATFRFAPGITVEVRKSGAQFQVDIWSDTAQDMVMHWAVNDWKLPDKSIWPANTTQAGDEAVQTPFQGGQHVQLRISEEGAPQRIVFVLRLRQPQEQWLHNGRADFVIPLLTPSADALEKKVVAAETQLEHWSLFQRFLLAIELLDEAGAGVEGMALMYTWLKLSADKQLDWYRRSNYQCKDLAHTQQKLAEMMAAQAAASPERWCRLYSRLALSFLPRGGGQTDLIHLGILNIMREHGIQEGHRPGISERFLEQWRQKLEINSSPEDVTICEAYIAFLRSGKHDDYWGVLQEQGITKERLESMQKPITAWPKHLPQLLSSMQHYLWVLKLTHCGADLDVASELCKNLLDDDLRWHMFDLLRHRHEWWAPGKIVELRRRLAPYWRGIAHASRDLLLLDVSLDNFFQLCILRTDCTRLNGGDLVELTTLVLQNATLSSESHELDQCAALWERVRGQSDRWSQEWAMVALAAAQRTELSLTAYMDDISGQVQPIAERLGTACGVSGRYIEGFGEQVVREQPVYVLSLLLQQLEPMLRKSAGVANWQIASQFSQVFRGKLLVDSLEAIQGKVFNYPVILLTEKVGGTEDIPAGVVAVLTESATDVLSHVAIRARSHCVLLATCFDDAKWAKLVALAGQHVEVEVTAAGDVVALEVPSPSPLSALSASFPALGAAMSSAGFTFTGAPAWGSYGVAAAGGGCAVTSVQQPIQSVHWAVGEDRFDSQVVGQKAANLSYLRGNLPDWIQVPRSAALPFGTFERTLQHPDNVATATRVTRLVKELAKHKRGAGIPGALAQLRHIISTQLRPPAELVAQLAAVATASGLLPSTSGRAPSGSNGTSIAGSGNGSQPPRTLSAWDNPKMFTPVWSAICKVWASKWNDRAWLSRQAHGVPDSELYMACLLQPVIPAQYAFVLHTADPVSGTPGELFGEVVVGMGEALVGNHLGRAFSFTDKPLAAHPLVLSLPSKRIALYAPPGSTLMVRSDSNGEDLESMAGAGLYDSFPVVPLEVRPVDYASEPLLWDADFREGLMDGIVEVGAAVEAAFSHVAQDIEGVWLNGRFTVVQSRPQVLRCHQHQPD